MPTNTVHVIVASPEEAFNGLGLGLIEAARRIADY